MTACPIGHSAGDRLGRIRGHTTEQARHGIGASHVAVTLLMSLGTKRAQDFRFPREAGLQALVLVVMIESVVGVGRSAALVGWPSTRLGISDKRWRWRRLRGARGRPRSEAVFSVA